MKHNGIVRLNFTRHERVGATRNFGKVTYTVRFDEMDLKKVMRKSLKYGIPFRYGEVETKEGGKIENPNYIEFNFELNYFAGGLSERLKDGAFLESIGICGIYDHGNVCGYCKKGETRQRRTQRIDLWGKKAVFEEIKS